MSELYVHLDKFGLSKQGAIEARLKNFSEQRLSDFLESYLELARKQPLAIKASFGATDLFPDDMSDDFELSVLQQLGMYANRIYIHDRLLKLVYFWSELDEPQYLVKYKSRNERVDLFRSLLTSCLEELLSLKPFVEAGIVYFTPAEDVIPRKQPGGMYTDSLYGPEGSFLDQIGEHLPEIPPEFKQFSDKHLKVYPASFIEGIPAIVDEPLSPRNMVAIQFENDPFLRYYQLFETMGVDESTHVVHHYFDLTGKRPVDPRTFENWVVGIKREVLELRMRHLSNDLRVATAAGAKFITNLPVSQNLVSLSLEQQVSVAPSKVISALLKLELPYFENVSASDIVKARQNEVAFAEFRAAMDNAFAEINSLPSESDFQKQIEQIARDLLYLPVLRIDQQMNAMRRNLFMAAVLATGSLLSTILTGGNNLVTAASLFGGIQAVQFYKEGKNQEDSIKQLPSFFYWQATHRHK